MNKNKAVAAFITVILLSLCLCGCGKEKRDIAFADVGWDSVKFHNAVAGFIAEAAYGFTWHEVPG
ncbi:MAG: ABC transporter permease, partial [Hydrogenoanaerobacterium sp.]